MTLFSRRSRFNLFVLLSLTASISSLALVNSAGDADARHRRGHQSRTAKPALPVVPPVPLDNPRAATATEAPKPEEKPVEEIQKADPKETPVPDQKPVTEPVPEAKPAEKLVELPKAEQQGPKPEDAISDERPEHDQTPEKTDPATSPDRVYQNACPAIMNGEVQGELVPPLSEGTCGERSPLKITAIGKDNPVKFAAPIITNCAMAGSLANWVVEIQKEAQKNFGAEIESIATGSDYQCRKVNNGRKGRVSEHAFANALDIMSFKFKNGKTTELGSGWKGKPEEQAFWLSLHKASCERFMTVIGPDGDAAHQGNLHLDLGCHGKSCEARICQ
ncbi:extensin family protein [Phyllobacterium sp. SB3]|uniref:extensin family protein n=1 Tax=Phyllobacterium sp. SB3 TaxID=3156073 RepID=UPI0032AF2D03